MKQATITIGEFEAGDIDAAAFDHEAHIRVAWLYLDRYERAEAIARFDAALRRLTARLGAPEKYHATVTWFFLLLIAERRDRYPGRDWPEFRKQNADLFTRASLLLDRYYTRSTLSSAEARRAFVLPDRRAA